MRECNSRRLVSGQRFGARSGMKPSKILQAYLLASCLLGLALTIFTAIWLKQSIIELNAALILPVCWNVLLLLLLPLVLDWSEQKYLNARFLQIEELANDNPELKSYLDIQCEKLSVSQIRVAVVESGADETLSYGLLGNNPRVIVPKSMLSLEEKSKIIPSIENELNKFARHELSLYFLGFTFFQLLLQQVLLRLI